MGAHIHGLCSYDHEKLAEGLYIRSNRVCEPLYAVKNLYNENLYNTATFMNNLFCLRFLSVLW